MNEIILKILQSGAIALAFIILILVILTLSMTFGPPTPQIPNAICTAANGTTFCHF